MAKSPQLFHEPHFSMSFESLETAFIDCGAAEQQLFTTFDVDGESEQLGAAAQRRAEQKELFLAGQVLNPILNECPKFQSESSSRDRIHAQVREIARQQAVLTTPHTADDPRSAALTELISMRITEHLGVNTAAMIAGGEFDAFDSSLAAADLKTAMRQAYGVPPDERGQAVLYTRIKKAKEVAEDAYHPAHALGREVMELTQLPELTADDLRDLTVTMPPSTVDYYQQIIRSMTDDGLAYAFAAVGDKPEYTVHETRDIMARYLDYRGYTEQGFSVKMVPNRSSAIASMSQMAILTGDKRTAKNRTRQAIEDTTVHEAEVHIRRMARARQLGYGLAGFALARANIFEEPFATTITNLRRGNVKPTGEQYTVAIALAAGYDAGSERDFRDSHEAQWRLNVLKTYTADKPLVDQISAAKKAAYMPHERIWRGMPTNVRGCIMPRDHAYDNHGLLEFLQPDGGVLDRDAFVELFDSRTDPRNTVHANYLAAVRS